MSITRNFLSMPPSLKILTASTLAVPAFSIQLLFAPRSIHAFGKEMAAAEWVAGGGGIAGAAISCLVIAAAVLMLQRSRYGRPLYICALLSLILAMQVLAARLPSNPDIVQASLIANLWLTAFVGIYLYWSKAVRAYFRLAEE